MLTIKLVVIGNSGVGKTSLRGQYISGRFSTGYRATIGADFITKTLPHPTNPKETVTLQIWDTAGQERFSSLSSAFFRGADAALLMYDVNQPSSLRALDKWWDEFCTNAPLAEEDMEDYCCVVVGNKMDLVSQQGEGSSGPAVSEREASESPTNRLRHIRHITPNPRLIPSHTSLSIPQTQTTSMLCPVALPFPTHLPPNPSPSPIPAITLPNNHPGHTARTRIALHYHREPLTQ
ncbi:ras-domain-containing protein [Stereum hirsutum FP-91666 SS1]|uniref:ras-domain-containing protein n=1 Tax=Stereum hirsutum (strain FP-91666) TaxID=721885 RepID=UPI0004409FBA|nr:ras-domain-containing protein [Stereum hirsutum FP-91666 SS1]EIM91733.1 ras-domain-containing protein [Stereum hirsutum FP-91666 SS1]